MVVSGLSENSPAQKNGILVGDVIIKFDNIEIDNTKNLSRMIAETPIGKKSTLVVWRDKAPVNIECIIEEMPEEKAPQPKINAFEEEKPLPLSEDKDFIEELGIEIAEITPEIMEKYSLSPTTKGLIITNIATNSDGLKKGLRIGNLIMKVDKKDVITIASFKEFVNEAKMENNRPVLLFIQDQGFMHFVALKLIGEE